MTKKERKFEYKMPEELAKTILKQRKKEQSKVEPQAYLCNYVNSQCGMMGTCVSVIVY